MLIYAERSRELVFYSYSHRWRLSSRKPYPPTSFVLSYLADDQFHEKYMKGGLQGGQAAARALIKAVTEPDSEEKPNVMVHIFFNRSSLGNGLIRVRPHLDSICITGQLQSRQADYTGRSDLPVVCV